MKPAKHARIAFAALAMAAILFSTALCVQAQTETTIYSFGGVSDGFSPYAGLIADSLGNLYGTTQFGGDTSLCSGAGCGTVFELTPDGNGGWTKTILHSFTNSDGAFPMGNLTLDGPGNLYGTTENGGAYDDGVVFELRKTSAGGWNEKVLHTFSGPDGAQPHGAVVFDAHGILYGTTTFGGLNRCGPFTCGLVYELRQDSGSWKEKIIYKFRGSSDGFSPLSGVAVDTAGNIFGTASSGGFLGSNCPSLGCGVAFELSPNSKGLYTLIRLHTFRGESDGGAPAGSLTLDTSNNIYGTAGRGGPNNTGVVYKLSHSGGAWTETVLHTFGQSLSADGTYPSAGVVFDTSGNLYGTTYNGGLHNGGVVFKLIPGSSGWSETTLYNGFPEFSNQASSVIIRNGNVFGTTSQGGSTAVCSYGCGVAFEVEQ